MKIISYVVEDDINPEGEEIFTRQIDATTTKTMKIMFERDEEHDDGFLATAAVMIADILCPIVTNGFYDDADKEKIRNLFTVHDEKAILYPARFLKTRQAIKKPRTVKGEEK